MNFTKKTWGALLFPAVAIGYAVFALWEQLSGNYKEITTDYTLLLAVPILFLAGIISLQEIFPALGRVMILRSLFAEPPKALEDDAGREETVEAEARPGGAFRVVVLAGLAFILVVGMEEIGYFLGFFLFSALVLLANGIRSFITILAISAAGALMVHFIFVGILDLDLPLGILEGLIGGDE
ncbi:MAG: tripartite tricarboxylate transporter TctB family protein [Alphaproteobacteria bacterium]